MCNHDNTSFSHKERYKDIQKAVSNQSERILHLLQASRHVEFTSSLLIIISCRLGIDYDTMKAFITAGRSFNEN